MGVIDRITRAASAMALVVLGTTAATRAESPSGRPVWVGTGSCAALACHGGRRDASGAGGSEYAYWAAYDPHNRAFSVLFDDRSKRIEKNFRRLANEETARPFADDLCLRCHVHQGFDSRDPSAHAAGFAPDDGAGCESCHGPAGKWLAAHTEAGWKSLGVREKEEWYGFRTTKDLLVRARICAECHVGIGTTDVDHDLIAAGHPRLNFEYGGQLAKLPKHWRSRDDRARNPDYEAKVWALGRLAGARAALDLLEARASRAIPENSRASWPEFAEYGCFSCHQGLTPESGRLASSRPGTIPGSLPWGSWYLAPTLVPGASPPKLGFEDPESDLSKLRVLMAQPEPDPAVVARRARGAAEELGRRADALNRGRISPEEVRSSLADVVAPGRSVDTVDWDTAAQNYLAIVALGRSLAEYDARYADPRIRLGLESMYRDLNLPAQTGRGIFDSPVAFDPARIRRDLDRVRDALPPNP